MRFWCTIRKRLLGGPAWRGDWLAETLNGWLRVERRVTNMHLKKIQGVHRIHRGVVAIFAAALLAIAVPGQSEAKIRCNGPWQIIKGQSIATPYCGDTYLAKVARGYGSRVSAQAIRNNPNTKREICQWIGHDIRVSDICAAYRNEGLGSGRF